MSEIFQDRFGRTVTFTTADGVDTYRVQGVNGDPWDAKHQWPAGTRTRDEALGTIESHIPAGWVEPTPDEVVPP